MLQIKTALCCSVYKKMSLQILDLAPSLAPNLQKMANASNENCIELHKLQMLQMKTASICIIKLQMLQMKAALNCIVCKKWASKFSIWLQGWLQNSLQNYTQTASVHILQTASKLVKTASKLFKQL